MAARSEPKASEAQSSSGAILARLCTVRELLQETAASGVAGGVCAVRAGAVVRGPDGHVDRAGAGAGRDRRGEPAVGDGSPAQERRPHGHRGVCVRASPAVSRYAADRRRLPGDDSSRARAGRAGGLRAVLLRLLHAVQGPDRERAARGTVRRRVPALRRLCAAATAAAPAVRAAWGVGPGLELAADALRRQQRAGHGGRGRGRRARDGGALADRLTRAELDGPGVRLLNRGGIANPDVLLLERADGARVVVKDYAPRSAWVRVLLAPVLVRREWRLLERVRGIAGVPRALERIDALAFAMEYLDGLPLRRRTHGARLATQFFDELQEILDALAERGLVYLDLRSPTNVLELAD